MKMNLKYILLIFSLLLSSFIIFAENNNNDECKNNKKYSFEDKTEQDISVNLTIVQPTCINPLGQVLVSVTASCGTPTIELYQGSSSSGMLIAPTTSPNNYTNSYTGLANGSNYFVQVYDNAGCNPWTKNFSLINPQDSFAVAINYTGSICTGNGSLHAVVKTSNPTGVTYGWSNSLNTPQISITSPDTYKVTVQQNGCTAFDQKIIDEKDFFKVVGNFYLCENMTTAITVDLDNGMQTSDFTYIWSDIDGPITSVLGPSLTVTASGTYSVSVSSAKNSMCSGIQTFAITEAPIVNLSLTTTSISCFGMLDGQITANANDGGHSLSFTYDWSKPGVPTTQNTISNLAEGPYSVTVTSEVGCTKYADTYIIEPAIFSYTITPTPDTGFCLGASGTLRITVSGGTAPYLFQWSDEVSPTSNLNKLLDKPTTSQTYTVTGVDNHGCTAAPQSTIVTISQPIVLTTQLTHVSCRSLSDGKCVLQINGGIPAYTYSWPSLTNVWNGINAGIYSVTVTDLYGCSQSANFEITQPDTLIIDIDYGNATCHGYTDGFVQVFGYGGTRFPNNDYKYHWNNGALVDSLAVGRGTYYVTVTDANGCSKTASAFVNSPEQIVINPLSGQTICIGEVYQNTATATGGLGPYDFIWKGSDNSVWYGPELNVNPIITTSYTVTATDKNGCPSMSRTITITVNPPLFITKLEPSEKRICTGSYTKIYFEVNGGNGGPYNYYNQYGQLINPPYNFYPTKTGWYHFRVSDDCGTPNVGDSVFITVDSLPDVAFTVDHLNSCPGEDYYFTEIHPDQGRTHEWDFGDDRKSKLHNPTHKYKNSGSFTVSLVVTDINGCKNKYEIKDLITIHPYPEAVFDYSPDVITMVNPYVTFENLSKGAVSYYWDFGDGVNSFWNSELTQFHAYEEVGEYDVILIAVSDKECFDTTKQTILIREKSTFYAPTVFTPNGDHKNDYFYIQGYGISKLNFELKVLDRWGEIVFHTEEYNLSNLEETAWDGTAKKGMRSKGDRALENGIYVWRCKYVDVYGKSHEESGTVLLVR